MNNFDTIHSLFATPQGGSLIDFIINLLFATFFSSVMSKLYIIYGNVLSNRKKIAHLFVPLTITTMIIITIVKSSLALSLGLVGALSIVRFRAAIKEPEELLYLFIAIAIGVGLGADQRVITALGILALIVIIWLKNIKKEKFKNRSIYLHIRSLRCPEMSLPAISEILQNYCISVNLKRFESSPKFFEAAFLVDFENVQKLHLTRESLEKLSPTIELTFVDNSGLGEYAA